jgi:hypothetical protein
MIGTEGLESTPTFQSAVAQLLAELVELEKARGRAHIAKPSYMLTEADYAYSARSRELGELFERLAPALEGGADGT